MDDVARELEVLAQLEILISEVEEMVLGILREEDADRYQGCAYHEPSRVRGCYWCDLYVH